MEKSIGKLAVIVLLAAAFACSAAAIEPSTVVPVKQVSAQRLVSDDFRIDVETNKDIYHNRDILRLTVKLLNNSPKTTYVVRPLKPVPAELEEGEIEEVFEGLIDDVDVDVAIMPRRPIIIGYATLTRLGPSPVPYPVPYAEEAPLPEPKPIKLFRLPLFGSTVIPGHSTRIISTVNILIACPIIIEPDNIEPVETEQGELLEAEPIEIIPAIGRYIALKPGYYLLNCHINKIAGARSAQAQKIIRIRPRILKPKPVPKPLPKPIK